MRSRREDGFTLIEMMIVVVIIGVLAAIAIPAYSKWVKRSKSAEVPQMLGHIAQREEAYRTEFGVYLSTGADDAAIYPALASPLCDSRTAVGTAANPLPASWVALRIQPPDNALYCGYVAVGGNSTDAVPAPELSDLWNNVQPTQQWFYIHATCNWDSSCGASTNAGTNEEWEFRGDMSVKSAIRTNELN
jgi:prepilin-type N-terminal cleavage/methylation domain-containing protein